MNWSEVFPNSSDAACVVSNCFCFFLTCSFYVCFILYTIDEKLSIRYNLVNNRKIPQSFKEWFEKRLRLSLSDMKSWDHIRVMIYFDGMVCVGGCLLFGSRCGSTEGRSEKNVSGAAPAAIATAAEVTTAPSAGPCWEYENKPGKKKKERNGCILYSSKRKANDNSVWKFGYQLRSPVWKRAAMFFIFRRHLLYNFGKRRNQAELWERAYLTFSKSRGIFWLETNRNGNSPWSLMMYEDILG